MSSDDLAISIHAVGKQYTIRHDYTAPTTLAEAIVRRVRHPFARATRENFWALRDVSFDVRRGEVLGLIGGNGAGKSTLLKILSRITEMSEGEVDLYGRVGSLLEVGTGFNQELTGRENIFLNGAILGMRRAEIREQFDAIVAFAGVDRFLDTPVKHYSSGMYVRLAFAVAAHLRSEILIVDEVLAVGDQDFQANEMVGDLRARRDRSGSGDVRAVSVALRALGGDLTRAIAPGDPFDIVVSYEARKPLNDVAISIDVDLADGTRLATLHSEFNGERFPISAGPGAFSCAVAGLPLRPDTYLLNVAIGGQYTLYDFVERAMSFDIAPADVFGTGRLPQRNQGPLIAGYRWRLEPLPIPT